MYGIISWIICGFAIFCILINIVYAIVYSLKSDNDKTDCSGGFYVKAYDLKKLCRKSIKV